MSWARRKQSPWHSRSPCTATAAQPDAFCPGSRAPHDRAAGIECCHLGHAGRQYRSDVPVEGYAWRQAQPDCSLARSARLAKPNADAQPGRHLSNGLLHNTKEGPVVIDDSAGRRWRHQRQHHGPMAGGASEDVGPAGVRQRRRRQVPDLCLQVTKRTVPAGYIALLSENYQGYALLCSILKSGKAMGRRQDGGIAYGRRIKLIRFSRAQPIRLKPFFLNASGAAPMTDDSVRPSLLPFARSLRAERTVAHPRQGDDRPVEDHRHRESASCSTPTATQDLLNAAASEAHARWSSNTRPCSRPITSGRRWVFPILPDVIGGLQSRRLIPTAAVSTVAA